MEKKGCPSRRRAFIDHGSLHDISLNDASDLRAIDFVNGGGAIAASGGHRPYSKFRCLPDQRNTVLFAGFQAAGTRGQTIQSGAPSVKIHGREVPIRARVESMENLSGHADYGEILRWLGQSPKPPQKTFLIHGEPRAAQALHEKIVEQLHWNVSIPIYLEKVTL